VKIRFRTVAIPASAAIGLLLAIGIAAPYVNADKYGERLRANLSRELGRQVEFKGKVQFSLFSGGFTVDQVVIHEDPAIGLEPVAYVDSMSVRPGIWALLGGRFVIASVTLQDASINLTKSGPASEWGHWNFASFVDRSVMSRMPAVHVRNGRIHFKFGDEKSVFYLTDTDLDISPPGSSHGGWSIGCSANAARTDRTAAGLGAFTLSGHWYVAPERLDLNVQLDRSGLGEITALMSGQSGGVHGTISSHLHLAGPLNQVGIVGRISIEDVHRWDLIPQRGTAWPLDVRGRIDLVSQQIELQSASADNTALPLWVRFHASDYLSQPRWAMAVNWNRFPVGPLMELAQHMGAQFPQGLHATGTIDGAIGYSGQGSLQGELALHDAAVTIPDSPPLTFEQAHVVLDHGHVRFTPAVVRSANQDEAQIQADYAVDQNSLEMDISSDAMRVGSLRAQVALAAVPWLEQVKSGTWSGQLHYHYTPSAAGWSGELRVKQAVIPVAGLTDPVELIGARARIDGQRVVVDQIRGKAGTLAFTGEFRYLPGTVRPVRLRLRGDSWKASEVEAEFLPTLRRSSSLLARALGRTTVPDWLKSRAADAILQVDQVEVAGVPLTHVRAHLLWEGARLAVDQFQAKFAASTIAGDALVSLRGPRPVYHLSGHVKGLAWQSGKLDAEGTVDTSGTGAQLLANLASEGTFNGTGFDFGQPTPYRSASGSYALSWGQGTPRFRLVSLSLRTEDETYTGHGATQDNGKLLLVFTDGSREIRVSGSPAKLRLEETPR
jgi:hypothetical protein